uniref:Mediator-associated protein 2 n=1 Tax=Oryza punctata TaxID=4537 RepID=A0A0E0JGL3_ORYPU
MGLAQLRKPKAPLTTFPSPYLPIPSRHHTQARLWPSPPYAVADATSRPSPHASLNGFRSPAATRRRHLCLRGLAAALVSAAQRGAHGGRCPAASPNLRLGSSRPRLLHLCSFSGSPATQPLKNRRLADQDEEPGPAFEENSEEVMLDISQTESTELWLIQWPLNQLDASDFHGQELTLKLHRDGKLSSLESSSGKSYDLVSFAAQKPDATVFLPSGPEAKAVGKIARRVSLVRYPDPEELEKPGWGSLTPSSKKSAGSSKKTRSRFTSGSKNRSSQGSALSLGQQSAEPAHKHNQKRKDESSLGHSNVSGKSAEGSQAHGGHSGTTSEVTQTPVEKSKKKNKKVRIAE